ncbi:CPBP family intramembrane metalloprotease [Mammaliicoccus stepanovicii]|nr:CPBP family intramembrane metalloprotease [Mammaliicoccus stepanovicii]
MNIQQEEKMITKNEIFKDDLSVSRENYFMALVKACIISLILFYLLDQGEDHPILCLILVSSIVLLIKYIGLNFIEFKKLTVTHLLIILFGYLLTYGFDTIYLFFNPLPTNQAFFDDSTQRLPLWASIISLAILPAIIEEFIFRGFMLSVIFRKHLFIGLIVSSVVFAVAHDSDTLIGYLPYFVKGLIFGLAYLKTRRIEVAILTHFLNNFMVTISSLYF